MVFASVSSVNAQTTVVEKLRESGVDVVELPDQDAHFSFADVLSRLHDRGVTHLLIEPGPTLTRSLLARGQADRVWVFKSPHDIDPAGGLAISAAPVVGYPPTGELELAGDRLTEYLNPTSPVFFASEPSADFVLTRDSAERPTSASRP
jgi:riboflavin biosynthesis pyrimidine reductase